MATIVSIDVINKTIPSLNNENIPIINKPNPYYGYPANAEEVRQLIQLSNYWIYESGTSTIISGKNYYDYFPEEELGGGITKEEVQVMINESKPVVDSVVSTTSTNAIQNSTITNFVNSSISTNTANYVGQFNSIEELNAYTGTVTNNDYAFVVGEDESGNTKYDRHKWVDASSEWLLEYTLNNSSFTAEEWASIQSGVKSQDVAQINTNKDDIANLSTTKADKTELVGKDVTGTKYTINGKDYTARSGAEIFNNYTDNKAVGEYSHAENKSVAVGDYSHAEGKDTTASGQYSHVEGIFANALSEASHSEGISTTASGKYSHAEGAWTIASGNESHAEGRYTKASSSYQHVQGKYNIEDTEGKYAFIIGNGTSDTERSNAFAIDWNGLIYQNNSTDGVDITRLVGKNLTGNTYVIDEVEYPAGTGAEIFNDYENNKAVGRFSHAEGSGTIAINSCSHAEGYLTKASAFSPHAEGRETSALGDYSHAEGYFTKTTKSCAHAEGRSTIAASTYQHVQGKYNIEDSEGKYAFIIGNGTSDTDRSNAFAIDWEGKIWQGNSSIGVQVSQNVDLTLEEYEALSDEEKNNGTYYNIIES